MKIDILPNNLFLARFQCLGNPILNGWPVMGIYGATISGFANQQASLSSFSLSAFLDELVIPGRLIDAQFLAEKDGEKILVLIDQEKQLFLLGWKNVSELCGHAVGPSRALRISALFLLELHKHDITRVETFVVQAVDDQGFASKETFVLPKIVRETFANKDIALPPMHVW
jgi:hypothetical protein